MQFNLRHQLLVLCKINDGKNNLPIKFSSLSAPTKIEELTAGSDEKTQNLIGMIPTRASLRLTYRSIPDLITDTGTTLQDDVDKANAFNVFFQKQTELQGNDRQPDTTGLPKNPHNFSGILHWNITIRSLRHIAVSAKEESTWMGWHHNWPAAFVCHWYCRESSHPF